jgi:DNA-binding transcriptional MerR regulator
MYRSDMTEEIWEPKPMGKDFVTTEEVSEVAGVNRNSLYEWVREGLLPAPKTTGGRGIIAKWPLSTLVIAKFVRSQRELGFGLPEIRAASSRRSARRSRRDPGRCAGTTCAGPRRQEAGEAPAQEVTAAALHPIPINPNPTRPDRRVWNFTTMIFDNIPGRVAVLTLHATACAHNAASPTTPRISIAVATIGFGPDNGLTPEEQAECELGKELFEELQDEVGQSFALSGVADPRGVAGPVLVMRFARVEGQSMVSGIKRIVLEGQLVKNGQVSGDFVAMRYTTHGAFGLGQVV